MFVFVYCKAEDQMYTRFAQHKREAIEDREVEELVCTTTFFFFF